ncbi:NAD(P)-binding domain-containing protein [Nocardia sp. NPDC051787]|uniref:NAD(P)-binding domain-containing protein n=1 Tax=Nocardia sp. NPDC051787 TaxID=3155415 RepID=UPI0034456F2C
MAEKLDCLVVGAGPAGIQVGAHFAAGGARVQVLEGAPRVGDFFARYPRSRRLISFNKVGTLWDDPELNLRWDWNSILTEESAAGPVLQFRDFSADLYPPADAMVRYLDEYVRRYHVPVRTESRVRMIRKTGDEEFEVEIAGGEVLRCRFLVVASGWTKPYVPGIPGIDLCEGYETASLKPEDYRGQRVLVLGKGNSAAEVAEAAVESAAIVHMASPEPVRLAVRTHHPGGMRLHLARLLDMYQLKLLNAILDCRVTDISQDEAGYRVAVEYSHADGERDILRYDRVIRCTGFRFDASIFDASCRPALCIDKRLPELTPTWESVNVPGLFFAGTIAQADDFRVAGSGFIDGFRYNVRTLHGLLRERYFDEPYPSEQISGEPTALADDMLRRASQSSALWLQFGYLCDVFDIASDGTATVWREWPTRDLPGRWRSRRCVYTFTLEWGRPRGDVFAIHRHPSAADAAESVFLHPVVRQWRYGQVVATHHVLEDLLGVYHPEFAPDMRRPADVPIHAYHERQHVAPLTAFLASMHAAADGVGVSLPGA